MWTSIACAVHCILTPLLLSLSPVLVHFLPGEEAVHRKLAIVVAGSAGAAVFYGFRRHRRRRVLLLMSAGVLLIIGTAWFGHSMENHVWEVLLTLLGSGLLITAHRLNHTFCRSCECVTHVCSGPGEHAHEHRGHAHDDHAARG